MPENNNTETDFRLKYLKTKQYFDNVNQTLKGII